MLKFWRAIRSFAEKQCQNHVRCDIKCPQCKLWYSAIGGAFHLETNDGYFWECGHCHCVTEWKSAIAPFPVFWNIKTLTIEKSEEKKPV